MGQPPLPRRPAPGPHLLEHHHVGARGVDDSNNRLCAALVVQVEAALDVTDLEVPDVEGVAHRGEGRPLRHVVHPGVLEGVHVQLAVVFLPPELVLLSEHLHQTIAPAARLCPGPQGPHELAGGGHVLQDLVDRVARLRF
eukprot:3985430-Lingulodinium_polyedra.AAC.1